MLRFFMLKMPVFALILYQDGSDTIIWANKKELMGCIRKQNDSMRWQYEPMKSDAVLMGNRHRCEQNH